MKKETTSLLINLLCHPDFLSIHDGESTIKPLDCNSIKYWDKVGGEEFMLYMDKNVLPSMTFLLFSMYNHFINLPSFIKKQLDTSYNIIKDCKILNLYSSYSDQDYIEFLITNSLKGDIYTCAAILRILVLDKLDEDTISSLNKYYLKVFNHE